MRAREFKGHTQAKDDPVAALERVHGSKEGDPAMSDAVAVELALDGIVVGGTIGDDLGGAIPEPLQPVSESLDRLEAGHRRSAKP